jgi:hypothetical protein
MSLYCVVYNLQARIKTLCSSAGFKQLQNGRTRYHKMNFVTFHLDVSGSI